MRLDRPMSPVRPLLLALACAGLVQAQTTTVVQGGGAALARAIAAAAPGDTLDVHPGVYTRVDVPLGISIVFRSGAVIRSDPGTLGLRVVGVPAGQRCLIRGVAFTGTSIVGPLNVEGCAGTVVLDRCDFAGSIFVPPAISRCTGSVILRDAYSRLPFAYQLTIDQCPDVSIVDSPRLVRLQVTDSSLSVANSRIPAGGSTALNTWGSDITLTSTQLEGSSIGGVVTPAVLIRSGTLTLAGRSVLTGGPDPAAPTSEVIRSYGGSIRIGPNARLVTAHPGPIQGPASVASLPIPSADVDLTRPGIATLRVEAEVSSLTWTVLGWPSRPLGSPFGELWFSPGAHVVDGGVVPGSGTRTVTFPFPAQPLGAAIVVQPVSLVSGGLLYAGGPVRTLVD